MESMKQRGKGEEDMLCPRLVLDKTKDADQAS